MAVSQLSTPWHGTVGQPDAAAWPRHSWPSHSETCLYHRQTLMLAQLWQSHNNAGPSVSNLSDLEATCWEFCLNFALHEYATCLFAVFTILGEAAFTRSQLPAGAKGRPGIVPSVGAALAFAAVSYSIMLALLKSGTLHIPVGPAPTCWSCLHISGGLGQSAFLSALTPTAVVADSRIAQFSWT